LQVSIRIAVLAAATTFATAAHATAQTAPTIPMEVFVGGMRFPAEISASDREVFGLRLGVDLGAFAGIRGLYWRGFQTGPLATAPLQGFGAEAQVNLNVGTGVTPFLVGGITRVDFMDGFAPEGQVPPEDFTAPVAGGGLRLDLGAVGVQAALRAHFLETTAGDGASTDLRTALLMTAGLTYRLGSSRRGAAAAPGPRPVRTVVSRDTVYVVSAADTATAPETFITIPIPREGEIYLRYGPPDTTRRGPPGAPPLAAPGAAPLAEADLDALRRRVIADLEPVIRGALVRERAEVQDLIRAELARQGSTGALSPAAEQRLLESIETVVALRVRQELARAAMAADSPFAVLPPGAVAELEEPGFQPRFHGLRPYAGMNVNRPRQFLLGTRLDLGPLSPARPQVRVLPEVVVGWGQGGTSAMMTGNLAYEARPLSVGGTLVEPYAYAGFGFLFYGDPPAGRPAREAVVNLGWGITVPVPHQGPLPRLFIEHQAVDLFDLHRVLVGVRM
jgi:hypothetical protein